MSDYQKFLETKAHGKDTFGFKPIWLPDWLYGFQHQLTDWAIRQGRCALFEDCGLGKTPQQLVWAENVVRKTNKKVLILTPLAVAQQTIREAGKFGIEAKRSKVGEVYKGITVVNYHRLHYLKASDFVGIVCDESSCLKSFAGKYRRLITDFMRGIPYRLLCSATPAPNDYVELGTSSEALGNLNRNQMLRSFFIQDDDPVGNIESTHHYRLKGHAHKQFWQWLASWARAIRRPSDLGYEDGEFKLPPLKVELHKIASEAHHGFLPRLATTLAEQRREKRSSLEDRCNEVWAVLPRDRACLCWTHLNAEANRLEKILPDAVQVAGSDPDDLKEERLNAFSLGQIRVLVSKPSICSFGMNWQHCSDVSYFPSHSHEQYYQAIRRCWRFGQKKSVTCHLVYSEAEAKVLSNMLRKERAADDMYSGILREMGQFQRGLKPEITNGDLKVEVPAWLTSANRGELPYE